MLKDILHELSYPLRDAAIVPAILVFAGLYTLAIYATLPGLWLLVLLVPALFQYMLVILQARAEGKPAPAVDVELFGWVHRPWRLFPLVLVAFPGVAAYFSLAGGHETLAGVIGLAVLMLLPLSLAVLALTQSVFQCLHPLRMWEVARGWGARYLRVMAVSLTGPVLLVLVNGVVSSVFLNALVVTYGLFLLATVAGHALDKAGMMQDVTIPDPVLPTPEELSARTDSRRTGVLNHAYGMASRGNVSGGVRHLLDDIHGDSDPLVSYRWYFRHIQNWNSPLATSRLGGQFVSFLLDREMGQEAIKVIVMCRHANPAFELPAPDRDRAGRLAGQVHDPALRAWLGVSDARPR